MKLIWIEDAWEEYLGCYDKDKRVVKKVNSFIKEIQRNGYDGIGKPEPLKGNYSGWWSLKINAKDRFVFKIEDNYLVVLQIGNHYKEPKSKSLKEVYKRIYMGQMPGIYSRDISPDIFYGAFFETFVVA